MDIQNSIMEIGISIMNMLISIMNSYTQVKNIYIFIMDTHCFIMDKYGWRCNSFNMQLIMDSHYWFMDILHCELFIIELWI